MTASTSPAPCSLPSCPWFLLRRLCECSYITAQKCQWGFDCVEGEVMVGGRLMRGWEPKQETQHVFCASGWVQPAYLLPKAAVTDTPQCLSYHSLIVLHVGGQQCPMDVPGPTWRCGQGCVSSEGSAMELCPRLPRCQRQLSLFACGSFLSSRDVLLHTQLSLLLRLLHLKVVSDFTGSTEIIQARPISYD